MTEMGALFLLHRDVGRHASETVRQLRDWGYPVQNYLIMQWVGGTSFAILYRFGVATYNTQLELVSPPLAPVEEVAQRYHEVLLTKVIDI
jgi:hypothetical protein